MGDNIYAPSVVVGLSSLATELTVATRIKQSSSNKLNTLAADSEKCKETKVDTYALNSGVDDDDLHNRLGVCHRPGVKLSGFQSRLVATRVSSYTEELW